MKKWLKTRRQTLLSNLLLATFFLLHYLVYMGAANEFPLIQSPIDPPFMMEQLGLCEEKYPTYFNPFQKVEHIYQIESEDLFGPCDLIERADGYIFEPKFEQIGWSAESYWKGYDVEGFMRPLAGPEYANLLFFLVQYAIAAGWIWVITRSKV